MSKTTRGRDPRDREQLMELAEWWHEPYALPAWTMSAVRGVLADLARAEAEVARLRAASCGLPPNSET